MARFARVCTAMTHTAMAWAALATTLLASPHAEAQSISGEHFRLVRYFDFEDTDELGNKLGYGFEMPRYWYAVGRDPKVADPNFLLQPWHRRLTRRHGFPSYGRLAYNATHRTSGDFALHLGLNGGNVGAFLEVGAVPAVPGSSYLITARVRTEQLERASAALVACLLDDTGQPLADSRVAVEHIQTQGDWQHISVRLDGDFDFAAWIALELYLTQPDEPDRDPLLGQRVPYEDVAGSAWFDDIAIWQVPSIEVATQSPIGVIRDPQRPALTVHVKDLTGHRLQSDVRIFSYDGRLVGQRERAVGDGEPSIWGWEPKLPAYGWYYVDLRVYDSTSTAARSADTSEHSVARAISAFLWMPDRPAIDLHDAARLRLLADDIPDDELALIPDIMHATGLRSVLLSAWAHDTTLYNLEQRLNQLDELLRRIDGPAYDTVFSFHPVPDALATLAGLDTHDPLMMIHGDLPTLQPWLEPVFSRHGQRVSQWQFGTPDEAYAFLQGDRLAGIIQDVNRYFRRWVPAPRYLIPGRVDQSFPSLADAPVDLALRSTGAGVATNLAEQLSPTASTRGDLPASRRWVDLLPMDADRMDQPRRLSDVMRRMLTAWRADAAGVALERGWTAAGTQRHSVLPDATLGAFTTLAHQLAGRRFVAELPLAGGQHAWVFDDANPANAATPRGGLIVAWRDGDSDRPEDTRLHAYLGERVTRHDLWGNAGPLTMEGGRHVLELDAMPVMVEGIDPQLARMRASFVVDEPMIVSHQGLHTRTIALTNPWPFTVTGTLQFDGPEGWTILPTRHRFSIAAGRTTNIDVQMSFPIAELAGAKLLTAQMNLEAGRNLDIRLATPLQLGLPYIDLEAALSIVDGGDVVVICTVTNTSEAEQSVYLFGSLPGFPRNERALMRIKPGETIVQRFHFANALDTLKDTAVRVGIREIQGPAVLNKRLTLEESGLYRAR